MRNHFHHCSFSVGTKAQDNGRTLSFASIPHIINSIIGNCDFVWQASIAKKRRSLPLADLVAAGAIATARKAPESSYVIWETLF